MKTHDTRIPHHDRYFRYAFSTPEAGRDLVRASVPEEILKGFRIVSVDTGGLDSVDETLEEKRLDLLITVADENGRTVLVYFLFEHKSYPGRNVLFQLWRYAAVVWTRYLSANATDREGKVPGIIPVVVYHGSKRWTAPTDLRDAVQFLPGAPALEQRFSYVLYDLHRTPATSIQGGIRTRTALLALKYAAQRLSERRAQALFDSLARLSGDEREFRSATVRYLLERRNREEEQIIFTSLDRDGYTEIREDAMTIAEALRSEGRTKGRAEGRVEGRVEGFADGRLVERAESLIDLYITRFGEIGDRERELIVSTPGEAELRAALREIVRPEATPESVLAKLRVR
jgi:predicted transposase/invertase (TIGR01784 family)